MARASSAALTFFPGYEDYVDGGLISNNPTLDALSELSKILRDKSTSCADADSAKANASATSGWKEYSHVELVLSLGCGINPQTKLTQDECSQLKSVPSFADLKHLLLDLEGAMCLVKLLQSSVTEANAHVVERAQSWCDSIGAAYVRLSPPTEADEHGHTVALDCKDMGQLMGLLCDTQRYLKSQEALIDKLCELLLVDQDVPRPDTNKPKP